MELTREQAGGMTVNERLYLAGLLNEFDVAVAKRDTAALRKILAKVFLSEQNIEAIVAAKLEKK